MNQRARRGFWLRVALGFAVAAFTPPLAAQSDTITIIETFAGSGIFDGGPATSTRLDSPSDVASDSAGNLYIADTGHNRIRKVDAWTGTISTVAGSATQGFGGDGGAATAAMLNSPEGIALDGAGNLYIADTQNHRIRKVDASTGAISTIAGTGAQYDPYDLGNVGDGGAATSAILNSPQAVALDGAGNLYIADVHNYLIRKVDASTGIISTVAGTGAGTTCGFGGDGGSAMLDWPRGVVVDGNGNLYIADSRNRRIRKVDASTGIISDFVGTGWFGSPRVALDGSGNLYIVDTENDSIYKVTLDASTGNILTLSITPIIRSETLGGDGGAATAARLNSPEGIALDGAGNLYIADTRNFRIRKVDASTGTISTIAGTGTTASGAVVSGPGNSFIGTPHAVALDGAGNLYIAPGFGDVIKKVDASTGTQLPDIIFGDFLCPAGLAVDGSGNLYIADRCSNSIHKMDASTGIISTVAGTGTCGFGGDGGDGGAATSATLCEPEDVAVDSAGNLYIADTGSSRIRKVDASTGIISTVAGGAATSAALAHPRGVALDGAGNLYIAATESHRIHKVDASTGIISTIAGTGASGSSGDGGVATAATLRSPAGVALDSAGNLYIADTGNHRIRRIRTVPRPPDEPPPSEPPSNEPPVAAEAFEDVALNPGERLEVSLSGKFRDPEGGTLTYTAESSDPSVVRIRIENGMLIAEAVGAGIATVTVTATDGDGLSASLRFTVQAERTARSLWRGWRLILLEPEGGSTQ